MAYTVEEFEAHLKRTEKERQEVLYRQSDIAQNGSDAYWDAFSEEIESHPIGGLGLKGPLPVMLG